MIIYFKVGNYKSIKDPITLNFNASSISELADSNIIETGKHSLLKSMILYGHNASGKSKILEAFKYFKGFIIKSASIGLHSNSILPFYPFLLNDTSRNEPSFFELSFVLNKIKYRYGFEADNNMIHKEWLLESKAEKEYPVFLRINQNFEIDFKRFKNANELDKRTKSNVLFLSVASQWNVEKSLEITNWLAKILGIDELEDDFDYKELTIELLKKDKYQQLIGKFLNVADLGIKKIDVHEFNFEEIEVSLEQFAPSNLTPEDKKYLLDVVKKRVLIILLQSMKNIITIENLLAMKTFF